jgi:hypothetical protein
MRRFGFWLVLIACVLAAVALRVYPLTIVQPFKQQNQNDLLRALTVFRIAPAVSVAIALVAISMVIFAWRSMRIVGRAASIFIVVLVCAAAWTTRINIYEQLMFHPAGTPQFASIAQVTNPVSDSKGAQASARLKLDPDDMLITVALHGDAHAYPIREIGYHHVVNDWVGGIPIVATY